MDLAPGRSHWFLTFSILGGVVTFGPVGPDRLSRRARVRPPYRVVRDPIRGQISRWLHAVPASRRTPDTARNWWLFLPEYFRAGADRGGGGYSGPERVLRYGG